VAAHVLAAMPEVEVRGKRVVVVEAAESGNRRPPPRRTDTKRAAKKGAPFEGADAKKGKKGAGKQPRFSFGDRPPPRKKAGKPDKRKAKKPKKGR
ncbi:MAG: hypothetical protein AAGA56_07105, partial [Myxococcota bacterium]